MVWCFWDSSMLLHALTALFFSLLWCISLYKYTKTCLSIHLLKNIWDVFSLGAITNKAVMNGYKSLWGQVFSLVLGKYLQVEFLRYMVGKCSTSWGTAKRFQSSCTFAFPPATYDSSSASTALFNYSHLRGVERYLIVVLTCTSWWLMSILSWTY